MRFKQALWDGTDPLYAPCVRQSKRWFYWRPPARYVAAGYDASAVRLMGESGDGLDLDRAEQARDLTRDMLRHYDASEAQVTPGSWNWLIGRYKADEFSPYQEVKANTRESYRNSMERLAAYIGSTQIRDTDLTALKRCQKAMKEGHEVRAREYNERAEREGFDLRPVDATDYVKRMFTMMRILIGYGVQIKAPGARDVRDILSELRIKSPKPRTASPTEAHIAAIVAASDAAGNQAFSLGLLCQWWLTLRAVDVRGQWLGKGSSARWADGLTWDMLDKGITTLRKTPSKTERSAPDELVFDLTQIPELRDRLAAIPQEQRVGPVIKQPNGIPFQRDRWSKLFRLYADAAGVPRDVWMMDTRAGAINHAKRQGASSIQLQHQANHAQSSTTDRYVRERSESVNTVIQMRHAAQWGGDTTTAERA